MMPTHLDMFNRSDLGTDGYAADMLESYTGEPSPAFEYSCLDLEARRRGIRFYIWFCLREVLTGKPNTTL